MLVNSPDGTAEAGISERYFLDESVRPVLGSSVGHDFLEARVDDVFLTCTLEFFHVRGRCWDLVAHHL
jgi:hypothetical protein